MKTSKQKQGSESPRGGRRAGAGRPSKFEERSVMLSVMVPESLLKSVDEQAAKLGISRSDFVRDRLKS